jgi:hypothetical protein
MSALLPLATQGEAHPAGEAAAAAALAVAMASREEGLPLLVPELLKGLEEPGRRLGSAHLIRAFCKGTRLDIEVGRAGCGGRACSGGGGGVRWPLAARSPLPWHEPHA